MPSIVFSQVISGIELRELFVRRGCYTTMNPPILFDGELARKVRRSRGVMCDLSFGNATHIYSTQRLITHVFGTFRKSKSNEHLPENLKPYCSIFR